MGLFARYVYSFYFYFVVVDGCVSVCVCVGGGGTDVVVVVLGLTVQIPRVMLIPFTFREFSDTAIQSRFQITGHGF